MRAIYTLLLVVLSMSLSAQSVLGKWKTIDDETGKPKSIVEIYKNGDVYEGKILKLFKGPDEEQDPVCKECDKDDPRYMKKIIGMTIVKDMEMDDGELDEGTILDPKKGEVYDCKIWVGDDGKLNVRGYIMFLYRTQTWEPYSGDI
ncbi:DUF2147 domain-containing protein [Salibacteraceae bacterium]|jgi:uncharacterized protein (DUF2147 family)|nr:DUF2147 domain-containing protein [Salibacteraceae bacterium]